MLSRSAARLFALVAAILALAAIAAAPAGAASKFKPGGTSAGDTLFPQIGNTGYDAEHYAIDLSYDPGKNRFTKGTRSTMTATATQNLSSFSLDFQRLKIAKVTVAGKKAKFRLADAKPRLEGATQPVKLIVTPRKGIPKGTTFEVAVSYTGKPVEIIDPDGSSEGWVRACVKRNDPSTCDGGLVVNEPVGAAGWFPDNNVPSDKASVRTAITVPKAYTAIGVGELGARESLPGGERRWVWNEDDPTATYLTTATVGRFSFEEGYAKEIGTGRQLPTYEAVDSTATPSQKASLDASFARTGSMISFLADRYGAYPFDSVGGIWDNVPSLGYALEVQTKPAYAWLGRDDATMLHELAHQWFGDSVSPEQWADIWFNEGWAEWSTWYWDHEANGQAKSPADIFTEQYAKASADDWSIPPATSAGDPANLFAEFPSYIRAPMMLEGLRQIVKDGRFFALARDIQSTYGHGNISTAQFIAIAKADSGLSGSALHKLGKYFHQWLYWNHKPTILPSGF